MSDQNRGAYTPQSEAPLAFDARHSRGPGERPMPLTLLASAGVLVLLVIALAAFFIKGSNKPQDEAPAPIDAMKSAPPVADAKPAERTGLQVYADGEPLPEAPAFASPPEAPVARPVQSNPAPVAAVPPARPAAAPPPVQDPVVQPAAPARPAPPPPAVVTAPRPAPAAVIPPPTSTAQVQIGAYSSAALAEDGWSEAAALLPGQMAGKTKRVQAAPSGGSTLYRTFVGGFTSRQEAAAFCAALKARGGDCLVRN